MSLCRRSWLVLTAAVLLACIFLPTVSTNFDFFDDGLTAYRTPSANLSDFCRSVWQGSVAELHGRGPFRPAVQAVWMAEAEWLGPHALAWRLVRFFWTIAAAATFLWFLLELNIGAGAALLTAAIAMWNPYRAEIWLSLTHSEGVAMPFALLALICAVRAARAERSCPWDVAGFSLMLIALACKNTFAGLVPAQMFLRMAVDLPLREGWQRHRWRALALALSLLLPLGHMILFKLQWHPGQYAVAFSWLQGPRMLRALAGAEGVDFLAPGLLLALAAVLKFLRQAPGMRAEFWSRYRAVVLAGLLILVGGTVMYLPVNGMAGRYTVPTVWGADLCIAVLLSCLAEVVAVSWRRAAYAFLGVGLAVMVLANLGKQDKLAARIDMLWQTLDFVEKETPPHACINWVGDVWPNVSPTSLDVDEGIQFSWHLQAQGRRDVGFRTVDAHGQPWAYSWLPFGDVPASLLISTTPPADGEWRLLMEFKKSYWAGWKRYRAYLWTKQSGGE